MSLEVPIPRLPRQLLRPPAVPAVAIARPDLEARFRQGLRPEHAVTLLVGPAGCGKSVLAAAQAAASGLPIAWASLADADVKALVEAVCAALAVALPGFSDHAARLLRGEADPSRLLRHSAGLVAGELEALAPGGLVLVLDGIDGPAGSADACGWLEHLVAFFPPEGQLVLIGREEPPLRLDGALVLPSEAWRLSPEEALEAYRRLGGEGTPALADPTLGALAWAARRGARSRPDPGTGPLVHAASLEAGAPIDAVQAFLAAGRVDQALRVLGRLGPALAEQAALERLERLLGTFPPEAHGAPAWQLARGEACRLRGELDEAERQFRAAEAGAAGNAEVLGRALLGRSAIAGQRGSAELGGLARAALEAFGPDALAGRAAAEGLLGVHALYAGEPDWREHLATALAHFRALGDHAGAARALHNQALGHAHAGEHDTAIALYGEAVAACQLAGRLPFPMTHVNRAVLFAQAGERAAARADAELGLRLARERGLVRDAAYARWVLARLASQEGAWPLASNLYEEALEAGRHAGDALLQVDSLAGLAEVALRRGLPARAWELVEEGVALRGLPWWDPAMYELALVGASTLATLGRRAEASQGLGRLASVMAQKSASPYRRVRVLTALAAIEDTPARAAEAREQARALAAAHGYADPAPAELEPPPVRAAELSLRLFGRLEAAVDGAEVPPQRWRGPRIQLLLAFLYLERAGATREQLEGAFFGEADASRAAVALMIKRLREALEPGLAKSTLSRFVLFEDGRYVLDRARGLEVDLDRFRHALDLASRAEGEQAIALREEALDLYRAPLLPDHDADWLESVREGYRRQAFAALRQLADDLIRAGRARDALARAEAMGRRDRCAEEPVMVRMQALAALGRRDEALRSARELGARLKHELGVGPSEELEALTRAIALNQTLPPL